MSNPNKKLVAASPYPDMLIEAAPRSNGRVFVMHIGSPEDLVASGAITAEMLALPGRKGAGNGRVDSDGIRFFLDRYFVTRDGQPARRCRVRRAEMPLHIALRLPGVVEALEAHARHQKDREVECGRQEPPLCVTHQGKARSHLRLVVDNTREVSP